MNARKYCRHFFANCVSQKENNTVTFRCINNYTKIYIFSRIAYTNPERSDRYV